MHFGNAARKSEWNPEISVRLLFSRMLHVADRW
jgi:hypothetical protein